VLILVLGAGAAFPLAESAAAVLPSEAAGAGEPIGEALEDEVDGDRDGPDGSATGVTFAGRMNLTGSALSCCSNTSSEAADSPST